MWVAIRGFRILPDVRSELLVLPCITIALPFKFGHFHYILVFLLDSPEAL